MSLPCYLSTQSPTADSLEALPRFKVTHDLAGESFADPIEVLLLLEPQYLLLFGTVPGVGYFKRGNYIGEYVEGLWEQDVVELFLTDKSTGQYQEFNFSPGGAWWHCRFSSYRTPIVPNVPPVSPDISVSLSGSVLRFRIGVPRKELLVDPLSDNARLNICGIIGKPRRYFSCAEGDKEKPDFHRTEQYLPLQHRPLSNEKSFVLNE